MYTPRGHEEDGGLPLRPEHLSSAPLLLRPASLTKLLGCFTSRCVHSASSEFRVNRITQVLFLLLSIVFSEAPLSCGVCQEFISLCCCIVFRCVDEHAILYTP